MGINNINWSHKMLAYAQTLLGVPYRWWHEGEPCIGDGPPFYASAGPPPTSPRALNCAGFINCLARFVGRPIPGVEAGLWYAGGTYAWYEELAPKCVALKSIDGLPVGSLLLRRFRDETDQGHLGVVWTDERIIHCWPDMGVVIEEGMADYFEFVCIDWL